MNDGSATKRRAKEEARETSFPVPDAAPQAGSAHRFDASFLFSAAFSVALFCVLRGPFIVWSRDGFGLFPSGSRLALAAALIAGCGVLRKRAAPGPVRPDPLGLALGPLLVFASDWMTFPYNFFQAPSIRGELLLAFGLSLVILRRRLIGWLRWLPVATAILLFVSFFQESAGAVIFSDDHTAVMYRLTLMREMFPHIPFYSPAWNAGMDARAAFSTGLLNVLVLFAPLIRFFPTEEIYNLIVASVLFLLLPGITFGAARREGLSRLGAALAATLALTTGLMAYRWGLKYGPMGFITSYALVPIGVSFGRVISDPDDSFSKRDAVLATILVSLMICWSPTIFVLLPAALFSVPHLFSVLRKRYVLPVLACITLVTLPWVVLWLNTVDVFKFVTHKTPTTQSSSDQQGSVQQNSTRAPFVGDEEVSARNGNPSDDAPATSVNQGGTSEAKSRRVKSKPRPLNVTEVMKQIRTVAMNDNPLLLFFGPMGLLFLPRRRSRWVFAATAGWLLFLGLILAPLKPQLEFERMLVVLSLLMCIPTAQALERLFASVQGAGRWAFPAQCLAGVSLAFFLTGVPAATAIVRNRTLDTYSFMDDVVRGIIDAIKTQGGEGRVVFTGFVLHELNRGHLAPLAYYTGHPLVASSPVHDTWWYTDVLPKAFRLAGDEGIEEYLDDMNATAVVAHDHWWREYFLGQPVKYQQVWSGGRFVMFRRLVAKPTYFASGSGEVLSQGPNEIHLRVDTPEAVLKFTYFPFLEASGCELSMHEIRGTLRFIKLTQCTPGSEVTVRGLTGYSRLFGPKGSEQ